jgi:hypothetical protein
VCVCRVLRKRTTNQASGPMTTRTHSSFPPGTPRLTSVESELDRPAAVRSEWLRPSGSVDEPQDSAVHASASPSRTLRLTSAVHSAAVGWCESGLHPVLPRSLLPPEGVYVPGPRAQYGVPAQGKECFSTRRAGSARDQSRSPPILEDYRSTCFGTSTCTRAGCRARWQGL